MIGRSMGETSSMDVGPLIDRVLDGDRDAFESLYAAHAGRCKAYFLRSGFAPADADDLTQETFLRVVRSLSSFDSEKGSFRAWLATITRNLARNRWAGRAQPDSFDPELAEAMLLDEHNPAEPAEHREQMDALDECVTQLPTMLAVLIRLRYVEGKTTRAMSDATGMPESTVRKRLDEARSALALCLERKGIQP